MSFGDCGLPLMKRLLARWMKEKGREAGRWDAAHTGNDTPVKGEKALEWCQLHISCKWLKRAEHRLGSPASGFRKTQECMK